MPTRPFFHRLPCLLISLACFLPCVLFAGCGKDIDVVPVSGKITNNSKPVAGVHVSFQPVFNNPKNPNVGRGSVAVTDDLGHYQLETIFPELPGAVPGTHIVRLSTQVEVDATDDAAVIAADPIAEKFRDGSIEFDVPSEGTEKADFDIGS